MLACGPELAREVTTQHEVFHKYPLTLTLSLYPPRPVNERTAPLRHFLVGRFGVNGDGVGGVRGNIRELVELPA